MKFLRSTIPILCTLLALPGTSAAIETRYHEYTQKFGQPTDGAKVISAGFFGGSGHEWLAAGGFAPDGTIVLAGNVIGPEFRQASVLGRDGHPPAPAVRQQQTDPKGKLLTNKDGTPKWKVPSWQDSDVTGFVLITGPDMKTVLSAHRLPWDSGAITACAVGQDGAIYLAGKATEAITLLEGDVKKLTASARAEKSAACDHVFLTKLSPKAERVLWTRHFSGPSNAPKLAIMPDGSLLLTAGDLRNFTPAGEETAHIIPPSLPGHLAAVNPKDASLVVGGEHHSPTGREPWRCPRLDVFQPDGTQRHQFHDWLGPYVGLDNLRLVSDTAVRRVAFDPRGDLLISLWSDGGNSVALREPFDVRTYAPGFHGLGFSIWGAGVLSAAYLVRIDPVTWKVRNGTMWMAYVESENKPNSTWIDQIAFAPDGSVCFTGRCASSLIQTENRLSPCQSGQHIAVLREDLSSIRFSSTVPGSGMAKTGDADETWGIATGNLRSKQQVLFLTGASDGDGKFATPLVNAGQDKFGGGWMDGYAVLLEMDKNPAAAHDVKSPESETDWQPVAATTANEKPPVFMDGKGHGPTPGLTFDFEAAKWVTVDAEFRDPSENLWPTFLYGHPKSGSFRFDPAQPELHCVLECDRVCQPNDDPATRVAGEWIRKADKAVDFSFEIKSLGPFHTRTERRPRGTGFQERQTLYATADAVLKTPSGTLPVKAECRFNWTFPRDGDTPQSVQLDAFFTTTGKALGLKNPKAAGELKVRVSAVANSTAANKSNGSPGNKK